MATLEKDARWYVYALSDPRDGAVFYVGKGCRDRMHQHEREAAKPETRYSKKIDRIRAIVAEGCEVQKQMLAKFWDEQAAYDHETDLIDEIGLANLTNVLPGGQKAWDRRRQERATRRRKEKPVAPMHEQLSNGADELISRFAEWFKAGGHKGQKFGFTALNPVYRFHAKLSAYVYNEFMPTMWQHIKQDEQALSVLRERIRQFGVEIEARPC
jgi:hypothetical protein